MKLSIITINYNNKAGLQKTIDSVIGQTWKDYEWIIIDGGSTDGSKELIEQYQQYFAYWCSEPDKGVYNAMNKGIAKAKGEYLNFMNSGDVFHDAFVLKNIFEKEHDEDILIGQVLCVGTNRIINKFSHVNEICRKLLTEGLCHQGTFSKLDLLKQYPFDENLKISSDWKFWLQTIICGNSTLLHMDILVADYDMTGISSTQHDTLRTERQITMNELFGERLTIELSQLYKEQVCLEGELQIPAIKMLRYLYKNSTTWFSVLYRVILISVKIRDFLFREKSYTAFEKQSK